MNKQTDTSRSREEELKTLKDIEFKDYVEIFDGDMIGANDFEIKDRLKQEAIKWIKELSVKQPNFSSRDFDGLSVYYEKYEQDEANDMVRWIKHFFNITEVEIMQ